MALSLPAPSLSTTFDSWAAALAAKATAAMAATIRMALSSDHFDVDALDHVVVIASRVVDQFADLRLARTAGCARHHHDRAAFPRRHAECEFAERVAAEILAEAGARPAGAEIGGDFDAVDAGAAVEGDALHLDRLAARHLVAAPERGDERIHDHGGDRFVRRVELGSEGRRLELAARQAVSRAH